VHMTNTRITDPEIIERRYPVIVKRFSLRANSGGRGKFNGGHGVVRELLFRAPITLSILTERRVYAPYGLEGKRKKRYLLSAAKTTFTRESEFGQFFNFCSRKLGQV